MRKITSFMQQAVKNADTELIYVIKKGQRRINRWFPDTADTAANPEETAPDPPDPRAIS